MDLEYWELLTGEAIEEEEEIVYRDIWVVAEVEDGVLTPVSLEMIGKARELAAALGAYVQAVLLGENLEALAQELIRRGADGVYLADDPRLAEYHLETYAEVLSDLFQEKKPEIILFGANYDDAYARALELSRETKKIIVPAFDDPHIIAGQGTIGLEILEALPTVEMVVVPIGGGALISGIATAIKSKKPDVEIIGVEPTGAAVMTKSLQQNKLAGINYKVSLLFARTEFC